MSDKKRTYGIVKVTIVWKPVKCIHWGSLFANLPQGYNPKAKAWINIENSSNEEFKPLVLKCPKENSAIL